MKNYNIQQNSDKEMIISFDLIKSSLIFPILFIVSMLIIALTQINLQTLQSKWLSLTVCIIIVGCIVFKDHFEWYKNKYHVITIKDEDLYINNKFHCPLYKLKSVNICYINKHNIGWMVYLDIFPDSSHDYTIKKRLQEKEAQELAETVSLFLDRKVKKE
ncbi:hypothetical protein ACFSJW_04485 [Flavobacterium artemisiae]|uniref:DUF304 domain-containing protein n=1 Tax=Flavobacterium artemisiae TaxID=2126556 RepID=A0ABW4HLW0_9FLAO